MRGTDGGQQQWGSLILPTPTAHPSLTQPPTHLNPTHDQTRPRTPAQPNSYLNRGTLTYSAPTMVADPLLGLTKTDIGAMTSAFPAAYGISKFAGGMLGAAFSPTKMLAYGLMATSVVNVLFGAPRRGCSGGGGGGSVVCDAVCMQSDRAAQQSPSAQPPLPLIHSSTTTIPPPLDNTTIYTYTRLRHERVVLVAAVGRQRRAAGHRRAGVRDAAHALVCGQGARQ